ncbi:hypothetical protein [Burkholderia stagnalis]
MPINWSAQPTDPTRKPLVDARGTANAQPTPQDRGLLPLEPVPNESRLELWARKRGYALDFIPQYGHPQAPRPQRKAHKSPVPTTSKHPDVPAALPPWLKPYEPHQYGTVDYGGPPLMRELVPHTIATMNGYEYLQDRALLWERPAVARLLAQLVMGALQQDPNRFFPFQVVGHDGEREILLGHSYDVVNRPSALFPLPPGRFPVQVTEVTPNSFTFTTQQGHFDPPGSKITFTITADSSGAIRLEHKAFARSDEPSPVYLIAPSLAAKAWDAQAANLRRWLLGAH